MKKISLDGLWVFIKRHKWLLLILALALAVRWYGIYFDYPRVDFIWDETYDLSYLMTALGTKHFFLNPPPSTYPALLPILYLPIFILRIGYLVLLNGWHGLGELTNRLVSVGVGQIYIIARWYAVVFGTATVFLIYIISQKYFKHRASALYASLVYAVSLLPVCLSHWGKQHAIMVFFVTLSWFFILCFEESKKVKFFYFSTLSAALAISAHYIGLSAIIFPLAGFFWNKKALSLKTFFKSSGIYLGVAGFFWLLNFTGVKLMFYLMFNDYYAKTGFTGIGKIDLWERFYYLFHDSFLIEPVFIALFLVVTVIFLRRFMKHPLIRYSIAGLVFNYLLMITIIAAPNMSRWLLIFITLSVPLAAGFLIEFLAERKVRRLWIVVMAGILIMPNFIFCALWLNLLRSNTSIETVAWLEKNVSPGDIVYTFDYRLDAPLTYQAALWDKINNGRDTKKNNFIIANPANFQNNITLVHDYGNNRFKDLAGPATKYVIISYTDKNGRDQLLAQLEVYYKLLPVRSFYPADASLLDQGFCVGDYLNNPSNFMDIFKLKKSGFYFDIFKIESKTNLNQ